jgi:hypothetical protein
MGREFQNGGENLRRLAARNADPSISGHPELRSTERLLGRTLGRRPGWTAARDFALQRKIALRNRRAR